MIEKIHIGIELNLSFLNNHLMISRNIQKGVNPLKGGLLH